VLVTTQFVADWMASRPYLGSLRTAVRLDPGNADYHHQLGRYYELAARDPFAALEQYKEAVRLNPHQAQYWLELGDAYQITGDVPKQIDAIEQGVRTDPTTPAVAWQAANLFLVQGFTEKALREFHVVMDGAPNMAGAAMQLCWRIQPDADVLLREVIPAHADSYLAFLSLMMRKEDTASAIKVWDGLIDLRQPISTQPVFDYIRYLLLHKDPDEATLAWREATALLGLNAYLPSSNNLIVNGDFHLDVLNGGFDWQYRRQSSVSLILDASEFHAGHRSLAISFDGPGVDDAGIYQLVAVHPNTTYQFSGYYKNGEIQGAGAPHFALQDLYSNYTYFLSDDLKYGSSWRDVSGEFTTGADTKVLILHVSRVPAGSAIRGKLWIDDFRLVQKSAAQAEAR
jgi:tetratricopeptide (TPR) repeat protein